MVHGYGSVAAYRDVLVAAETSGRVTDIHEDLRPGRVLRPDEVIVQLDLQEYEITRLLSKGADLNAFGVGTYLTTGGEQPYLKLEWKKTPKGADLGKLEPFVRRGKRVRTRENTVQARERVAKSLNGIHHVYKKLKSTKPLPAPRPTGRTISSVLWPKPVLQPPLKKHSGFQMNNLKLWRNSQVLNLS